MELTHEMTSAVAKSFGFTVPPKVRSLQLVHCSYILNLVHRCTWLWSPREVAGGIAPARR